MKNDETRSVFGYLTGNYSIKTPSTDIGRNTYDLNPPEADKPS